MDPDLEIAEPREPSKLIQYLREKCLLPEAEITRKLLMGETFNIKGEGNQLDTSLMEEVLNENDFYEKMNQKLLKDEALKFVKNQIEQWSLMIAKTERKINKD